MKFSKGTHVKVVRGENAWWLGCEGTIIKEVRSDIYNRPPVVSIKVTKLTDHAERNRKSVDTYIRLGMETEFYENTLEEITKTITLSKLTEGYEVD